MRPVRWRAATSSGRSYWTAVSTSRSPYGRPMTWAVFADRTTWRRCSQRRAACTSSDAEVASSLVAAAEPDDVARRGALARDRRRGPWWWARPGCAAGCPAASRRTTSITAGSTSQVSGRPPAARPLATTSCSAPDRRLCSHWSVSSMRAVGCADDPGAHRQHERGRLHAPVGGHRGRDEREEGAVAAGGAAAAARPRWRRARARRTSRPRGPTPRASSAAAGP